MRYYQKLPCATLGHHNRLLHSIFHFCIPTTASLIVAENNPDQKQHNVGIQRNMSTPRQNYANKVVVPRDQNRSNCWPLLSFFQHHSLYSTRRPRSLSSALHIPRVLLTRRLKANQPEKQTNLQRPPFRESSGNKCTHKT